MKMYFYPFWTLLFLSLSFMSCGVFQGSMDRHSSIPVSDHISDLVIIYHGGGHRPEWNTEQIKHYLFRERDGQVDWLFDGFLFMEIRAELNHKAYDFGVAKPSTLKPGKSEWKWLIDKTFADVRKGPGAIEYLLDSMARTGNPAPFKRKIVIGIPNPIAGTKNWGSINGVALDFNKNEDRIRAAKWYIDASLDAFKQRNYAHLELEGFYWINEAIVRDFDVIKAVNDYIHQKHLRSSWIPYNYAPGADKWDEAGFDIAYQQSNYFFTLDRPMSIMKQALEFAKINKMAMEMEFDGKVHKADYLPRFYDYIEMYDKYGVWQAPSVAYYEGGGTWMNMARSADPAVLKAFNDLAEIVIKRQKTLTDRLSNAKNK